MVLDILRIGDRSKNFHCSFCNMHFFSCYVEKLQGISIFKRFYKYIQVSFFTFLGLVISIPMLIKNFITSIVFYKIIIRFLEKGKIHTANLKLLVILFVIIMNFIFAYAAYYFFDFNTVLKYWIDRLYPNFKHGLDNININYFSWIKYLFNDWFDTCQQTRKLPASFFVAVLQA